MPPAGDPTRPDEGRAPPATHPTGGTGTRRTPRTRGRTRLRREAAALAAARPAAAPLSGVQRLPANLRPDAGQKVRATACRATLRADASRPGTERGVVILRHGRTSPKPGFSRDSAVRNGGKPSLLKNDGSGEQNPECHTNFL
ncbi:hypothetical protein [Acetobacter aceti]|uniref:hypothetical protein n=1 Tax=Acetobacter aceti TaxID=435 RepID=UPI001E60EE90|nr:hypothetical protein [Acetobacter aceti]